MSDTDDELDAIQAREDRRSWSIRTQVFSSVSEGANCPGCGNWNTTAGDPSHRWMCPVRGPGSADARRQARAILDAAAEIARTAISRAEESCR